MYTTCDAFAAIKSIAALRHWCDVASGGDVAADGSQGTPWCGRMAMSVIPVFGPANCIPLCVLVATHVPPTIVLLP